MKSVSSKIILILGGYGGTGRVLCRWLLKTTNVSIIIAGRNIAKAEGLSAELSKEFPLKSITANFADASDEASLVKAFKDVSLVIDATTATNFVNNVARAAMSAEADCLDFHFDQTVIEKLRSLESEIKKQGRCFITQAGFHPGLPATFVRYAAPQFDEYKKAFVGMAMSAKIENSESLYELIDIIADYKAEAYQDGAWKRAGYRDFKKMNLGPRFGTCLCAPIQMEEMMALPEMYRLQEAGVYVAGFNWFVDNVVCPLAMLLFKIKKGLGRKFIARLFKFGMNYSSKNKSGVSFVLEAEGVKDTQLIKYRVLAECDDAYDFTAIPIVACIRQYLDESIAKPGLWLMGQVVEPNRLIKDMEEMGVKIEQT